MHKPQTHGDPIIPATALSVTALTTHVFLATLTGLALRLFFALRFPAPAGDSQIYIQLARNWADHHVYGLWVNGQLVPTDLRMPGYPALLATIAYLFGRTLRAIVLSQVAIDLIGCFLLIALALALVQERLPAPALIQDIQHGTRRRVAVAVLWLSATCPFVANYSAVVLTEVLVTVLTTVALLCFVLSVRQSEFHIRWKSRDFVFTARFLACAGAFVTGTATLVRPEMPLLLIAAAPCFLFRWWKQQSHRIFISAVAIGISFLLPLIPWGMRNFITLHEIQISAPRYATMPGEYAPVGYFAWTKTWLERYRDVYTALWPIGEETIDINDIPGSAFDSPAEQTKIATLLDRYNNDPNLEITPGVDNQFREIARERTARNPLRTFLLVPFQRALSMWFTPRTELLPIEGKFWPIAERWRASPMEFVITAGLGALGYLYAVLALAGIWTVWKFFRSRTAARSYIDEANLWGVILLVAFIVVRTLFLTTVEAPEPRYVIPCYPAVLALASLLWMRPAGRRRGRARQ